MKLLSFEQPLQLLYLELEEKKRQKEDTSSIEKRIEKEIEKIYENLTPYNIVEIARHPDRPHTTDYISSMFSSFLELKGDRAFGDDSAIIAGIVQLKNGTIAGVLGHRKGSNLKENLKYRYGMAEPEGYRKALRVANLIAYKFHVPIISFLDTPGASPTMGAEERGQAEAIAKNLREFFALPVPIIAIVIGEGGSGGALGIGIADKILMLKYSIYSVISPEGCASILWRDASKVKEASNAMKLTAKDLLDLGVIDEIIEEPFGGAHRHKEDVIKGVELAVEKNLADLRNLDKDTLLNLRYEKYSKMGVYKNG